MPQAGAMEDDVAKPGEAVKHAKVTNKVIECCIHLTVFQGKVVINSGCRDKVKITKSSPALCWKASTRPLRITNKERNY